MNERLKIEVTPNLEKCLEALRKAIQELPPGDLKDNAEGALKYMSRTFEGIPQPLEGKGCPPGEHFIPG